MNNRISDEKTLEGVKRIYRDNDMRMPESGVDYYRVRNAMKRIDLTGLRPDFEAWYEHAYFEHELVRQVTRIADALEKRNETSEL